MSGGNWERRFKDDSFTVSDANHSSNYFKCYCIMLEVLRVFLETEIEINRQFKNKKKIWTLRYIKTDSNCNNQYRGIFRTLSKIKSSQGLQWSTIVSKVAGEGSIAGVHPWILQFFLKKRVLWNTSGRLLNFKLKWYI